MTATTHPASIRVITADTRRLVAFYERVTGVEAQWASDDFAELQWPTFTLAVGSTATLVLFGGDVAAAAANRSAIVEFRVDDVDAEHDRIRAADPEVVVVQPPTTMPWGNRSVLLRDPDGTLVNLFSPPAAGRHVPATDGGTR